MTTIVIPVAVEWHNPSLPLALETIAEHTDYEPVTIGHDHGHCTNINTTQLPGVGNRFHNTDLALHTALNTPWISDPFIWTADDIYWTRPAQPPDWHQGELPSTPGNTTHQHRKAQARTVLERAGLPTFDYELHTPLLVHKDLAREALHLGVTFRTAYGNTQGTGTYHEDVKARPGMPIPDGPFLSSQGATFEKVRQHILGLRHAATRRR